MGRERSGDCTEIGDNAVIPRLPRFLHVGKILRRLLPLPSLALGKLPIQAYPLGLREGCFNACAGLHRGVLWASKWVAIFSPGPGPTVYRLPIAPYISSLHSNDPRTKPIILSIIMRKIILCSKKGFFNYGGKIVINRELIL
jgi:hypothetical protein